MKNVYTFVKLTRLKQRLLVFYHPQYLGVPQALGFIIHKNNVIIIYSLRIL